jgi:hypothetical protein
MAEININVEIEDIAKPSENYFFSAAELNFLKGTKSVSSNYERVLLHRIFKKTQLFQRRNSTDFSRKSQNTSVDRGRYGKLQQNY